MIDNMFVLISSRSDPKLCFEVFGSVNFFIFYFLFFFAVLNMIEFFVFASYQIYFSTIIHLSRESKTVLYH